MIPLREVEEPVMVEIKQRGLRIDPLLPAIVEPTPAPRTSP